MIECCVYFMPGGSQRTMKEMLVVDGKSVRPGVIKGCAHIEQLPRLTIKRRPLGSILNLYTYVVGLIGSITH